MVVLVAVLSFNAILIVTAVELTAPSTEMPSRTSVAFWYQPFAVQNIEVFRRIDLRGHAAHGIHTTYGRCGRGAK
jgi:hypothetical protein